MFAKLLVAFTCASTVSHPVRPQSADTLVVIRNVTVIDGTDAAPLRNTTVVIRAGKIASITRSAGGRIPAGARVIDGAGQYLIPGLIDTHMHIRRLTGTDRLDRLVASNLAFGITGIREASASGSERELVELRTRIERGELLAPRLYVAGSATLQNVTRHQAASLAELVAQLRDLGVDGIKLRMLSAAQADTVIAAARAHALTAFGHTWSAQGSEYSVEALRAGASGIMHVSGIGPAKAVKPRTLLATDWQRGWLQLYLQWVDATVEEETALLDAFRKSGAWLEPTLTTEAFVLNDDYRNYPESKLTQELWEYSYEMSRPGFPTYTGSDLELARQGFQRMKSFVRRFHEAGGLVIAGTDMTPWAAGGLHEELRLLVEAGLSPLAALQAGTRNAARALGWEARTGTITVGRDADLVLLAANPLDDIRNTKRIRAVIRGGRVLDRIELDRLIAPR